MNTPLHGASTWHSPDWEAQPWLWPSQAPEPLTVGLFQSDAVHTVVYRERRITVRASGQRCVAFRAFIDGWPVVNRRRAAPSGFPTVDQAIGRCKQIVDAEAPARRWRSAHRLVRRLRTAFNKAVFGDRRGRHAGAASQGGRGGGRGGGAIGSASASMTGYPGALPGLRPWR